MEQYDIAVAQLQANVLFLRSQLRLALATIQAKDATIEALDFTVFQQRQLLTGGAPMRSADAEEPVIGDVVYVSQLEGKGLRIDLAALLRRLKRRFGTGK